MLNQPFFQSTLPLMITIVVSVWAATFLQNKRFEDLKDTIKDRFDKIDKKLDRLDERIREVELSRWK